MPSKRILLAAALGIGAAATFVRLGFWQLDRLRFRRLENDLKIARLDAPPGSPFLLRPGTRRFRRVTVTGTFDFDHQIVLAGRSLEGSPGVYVITPLTPDVGPGAVLVNRGWLYAPDAQTVELAKADEAPHTTVVGYVDEFSTGGAGFARTASTPNAWRRMDAREIQTAFPYPIAPFFIVAQADSGLARPAGAPRRLPLPAVDEGPHLGYAIQWFAFAVIALVGASVVIYREARASAAV